MCRDFCLHHICLHLLFCFSNLHLSQQGHIPCIKREKTLTKFLAIFLINIIVHIDLVVNSAVCSFDFEIMSGSGRSTYAT